MSETAAPPRKPRDDEMDVFGLSHTGTVRKENQDHYLMATFHKRINVISSNLPDIEQRFPNGEQRLAYLAMVADGVGGGVGGAEASAIALESLMRYVDGSVTVYYGATADATEFSELLQSAAMQAHDAVRARRDEQGLRGTMATTLTMYIGVWPTYYLLQVGDSRYYVWRNGVLSQVTRDQTMAQDLVDDGILKASTAGNSPMAHVLSSAIGADKTMPVVTRLDADWNNVHLICSDGLTKHVTDARIAEILGSMTSAKQAAEQLLQEALDGGGSDNITIIIGRTTPKPLA
ncbi:serine/threonine-protein phosphatase [Gemmatimonas sp.]|uniref:PP2C family protein-serine/threonine phosphatase n=1 Tax=Gemmatimonas sp. TaxID=1962908 RepID=UPI00286CDACB|nr:serine/threonine-protein phosphatase [Gemmatimonas sp.]